MRYYVVSDVHGFYTHLIEALENAGFFEDKEPHKLIVCGDMMDRGNEAVEMQEFMLKLLSEDKLIFIRGNHEDLFVSMLDDLKQSRFGFYFGTSHHVSNGTWSTALQLTGVSDNDATENYEDFINQVKETDFYKKLIPASVDYYETPNYIFVHGWIPCFTEKMPAWYRKGRHYNFNQEWRDVPKENWDAARWFNGMELAEKHHIVEPNKTIVCGHWHASYGHSVIAKKCSEFDEDADFSPYYGNGVIGIDTCTAHTRQVNCLLIED